MRSSTFSTNLVIVSSTILCPELRRRYRRPASRLNFLPLSWDRPTISASSKIGSDSRVRSARSHLSARSPELHTFALSIKSDANSFGAWVVACHSMLPSSLVCFSSFRNPTFVYCTPMRALRFSLITGKSSKAEKVTETTFANGLSKSSSGASFKSVNSPAFSTVSSGCTRARRHRIEKEGLAHTVAANDDLDIRWRL